MTSSPTDEDVLNVFRELDEPYEDTLTTDELTEELPVEKRAVQDYVKDLESKNRLVLEYEGKPDHWRLSRTEPSDPAYDKRLGKAKRWGNKAKFIFNWTTLFGIGILAAVGIIEIRRENPRVSWWDESPHGSQTPKSEGLSAHTTYIWLSLRRTPVVIDGPKTGS